jgi:hypothetical protein
MQTIPTMEESFMPRRTSSMKAFAIMTRPALLGIACAIAAAVTLAVGEFRPARSLGPLAGAQALAVAPSRADLDHAHGAFERFRDQPDAGTRTSAVANAVQSPGN